MMPLTANVLELYYTLLRGQYMLCFPRMMALARGEESLMICLALLAQRTSVTDEQTDRRMDRMDTARTTN